MGRQSKNISLPKDLADFFAYKMKQHVFDIIRWVCCQQGTPRIQPALQVTGGHC